MEFSLLTLLLYIWLTSVVIAGDGPSAPHCCLTVKDTRIEIGKIVNYTEQKQPLCPVNAVKFYTKMHKTICSDPGDNWAKHAMRQIDARTTTKPTIETPKCITSTSTRIQTTSIKTPGPETKTSSRTVTTISSAPSTVTTLKTTRLRTKIWTTTTKPAIVSTETSQSPMSSAKQCTEPNHSTETSHKPSGKDKEAPHTTFTSTTKDSTIKRKQTPSKMIQRKRRKSKKQLRKYQMKMGSQG